MPLTEPRRSLLAELLARDDDIKIIPWPRRPGVKVGLRLLSDGEMAEADQAARNWARTVDLDTSRVRHSDNEFAAHYAAEILHRALLHPESRQPLSASVEDLRKLITRQELDLLTREYNDFARDMLADPESLTTEDMEAILDELRGPFGESRSLRCAPAMLRRLLLYTVSRPAASTG